MTPVFVFTNHKGGVGKSTSGTTPVLGIIGKYKVVKKAGGLPPRAIAKSHFVEESD
jgi:hypothetical protein